MRRSVLDAWVIFACSVKAVCCARRVAPACSEYGAVLQRFVETRSEFSRG